MMRLAVVLIVLCGVLETSVSAKVLLLAGAVGLVLDHLAHRRRRVPPRPTESACDPLGCCDVHDQLVASHTRTCNYVEVIARKPRRTHPRAPELTPPSPSTPPCSWEAGGHA
ncbi:MAG: hypothetical protein R3F65_23750 [bacterium]